MHFFCLLLPGQLFGSFFKLVVEGKPQDISQHLLTLGRGLPGELVSTTLLEVSAVDEGIVVHMQKSNELLLRLGHSVTGDYLETVIAGYE